ncbi:MAG: hypothetical protein GEV07_12190 [Streptosporangiales bacterium]|nr:hypothetical protein [Streptosporangiales bacterium]
MVDRLLLLQGLPLGAVPPIRDAVLACESAGLDALAELVTGLDAGTAARPGELVVTESGCSVTSVDCVAQHALLVLPALLDLVRTVGVVGEHELRVREVRSAAFLGGLSASLGAGDPTVEVTSESGECVVKVRPCGQLAPEDLVPYESAPTGIGVDEELWWRLYRKSNLVLSPDDPVSRRHAGATLIDEAGRVFGDTDEVVDKDLYQGRTAPGFDETRV